MKEVNNMFRYRHLFRPLQFIVIYGSAIAFWYTFLPEHWLTFLARLSITLVVVMLMFVVASYVVGTLVRIMRRRYKWARRVFMKP